MNKEHKIISHGVKEGASFEQIVEEKVAQIKKRGDLPYVTVKRQLEILHELTLFPLGRFQLINSGLNGFWTHYIVMHPLMRQVSSVNIEGKPFSDMETFILERCPVCVATQERYAIFQQYLQKEVAERKTFASLPCGLMGDLLTLDYTGINNIKLIGLDLDQESLRQSSAIAKKLGLLEKTEYIKQNAWQLSEKESFDVLTSNGLNIYETDDKKIKKLYSKFYQALKENGVLITSFLTPSPMISSESPWDMTQINEEDLLLQKIIYSDIIPVKWLAFQTEAQTKEQLQSAGFSDIKFIYDKARMFPTVIAKK